MANSEEISGRDLRDKPSWEVLRAMSEFNTGENSLIPTRLVRWAVQEIQRIRIERDIALAQLPLASRIIADITDRMAGVRRDGE